MERRRTGLRRRHSDSNSNDFRTSLSAGTHIALYVYFNFFRCVATPSLERAP